MAIADEDKVPGTEPVEIEEEVSATEVGIVPGCGVVIVEGVTMVVERPVVVETNCVEVKASGEDEGGLAVNEPSVVDGEDSVFEKDVMIIDSVGVKSSDEEGDGPAVEEPSVVGVGDSEFENDVKIVDSVAEGGLEICVDEDSIED